jgi:DNA-3-methyladenine glycosylase
MRQERQTGPTGRALPPKFYEPSAEAVARGLLGHFLLRRTPLGLAGGPIVETEAYLHEDPACHAAPGETARNRTMFRTGGHGYVYFIYGCHYCVNAVCRPAGIGEAVLIRAIEPWFGLDFLRCNRASTSHRKAATNSDRDLTNGPGKLCQALGITKALDGVDLTHHTSELVILENADVARFRQERGRLVVTTRIGITKAANLPLRFYLAGSPAISKRDPSRESR